MPGGLLLQLSLLVVTCGLLVLARQQFAFSPLRMFLYGWVVVLGTSVSGLVVYGREFAVLTTFLVLGSILAFAAGTFIAPKYTARRDQHVGAARDKSDAVALGFLCLLAAIGVVLVFRDMWSGGFALLQGFGDLAGERRESMWTAFNAGEEQDSSPVRSIGVAACLAVATLLPVATKQRRRRLQIFAIIAAAVVTADAILAVGRFNFGVMAVCLLVSTSVVYGGAAMRKVITLRRLVIAIPVLVYFLIVFPTQRSTYIAASAQRSVRRAGDSDFPDWVLHISEKPGMGWFQVFARSTEYFSGSLDKLNYFVTETDVFTWYKAGLYNVPQVSQAVGFVDGGITPWHQIRLDIAQKLGFEGWAVNPWSTGIRDFGIDFGVLTVLVIFLLGYVAQTVFNKCEASGSFIGLITCTYISVGCSLFAIISPFQIRLLSNGFWLLAALALLHYLLTDKSATPKTPDRALISGSFV